jgi:hypothetical protein
MAEEFAPIVVDLGKQSRKRIKDLKRGKGKLPAEALETATQVRQSFGDEATGKEFVPIIVVYTKKRTTNRLPMKLPSIF